MCACIEMYGVTRFHETISNKGTLVATTYFIQTKPQCYNRSTVLTLLLLGECLVTNHAILVTCHYILHSGST